ncbi:Ni,Fe-hydrogenase I large subunit [Acidianus sulfidivorans JP7]|uniref:Ni,Fe-hydrogenase I large subunit n=1 Tax=Acidianus sulfidivorans JP7 TaxID=619593 RepID=A0A2U9IL98_9CREN|nr:nickel-dependent hydrogenase large subunit [Acidianus sulfidivorans]AWR96793.1 Ni,Fe-hydrogenase I large subunit [Acidianus sulfidivorans JP7]
MVNLSLDPISRIEGHLGVFTKVEKGEYIDAKIEVSMFRGFENLLKGKDLHLAPNIAAKICGVCGATHTLVSTEALEMASGLYPSETSIAFRNIGYSLADIMYNNITVLYLFQAIDYSSEIMKDKAPKEYERAKNTSCEFKDIHGYSKISDIMDNLYFGKEIYKEAFKLQTDLRDLATAIWLRYPQPLSIKPGSITIRDPSITEKVKKYMKEDKIIDKLFYIMAELRNFVNYYNNIEEDFVTYGLMEGDEYNADYEDMDYWADKRLFPPALIRNKEIIETNLTKILLGVRVYVEGTPYEKWNKEYEKDELGNEIDEKHPWNKETKIKTLINTNFVPTVKQFKDIEFMPTTGDLARLYAMRLRRGKVVALNYKWEPRGNNVIERTFARMFTVAFLKEFLINVEVPSGSLDPKKGKRAYVMAVGAHDAPRGANAHWLIRDNDKIKRYQIVTPSDRNFSPLGGPVEKSIIHQKVTEEVSEDKISGLDALRIVRSFDPCSACAVHLELKNSKIMIPV